MLLRFSVWNQCRKLSGPRVGFHLILVLRMTSSAIRDALLEVGKWLLVSLIATFQVCKDTFFHNKFTWNRFGINKRFYWPGFWYQDPFNL